MSEHVLAVSVTDHPECELEELAAEICSAAAGIAAATVERVVRGWRRTDNCADPDPEAGSARFGLQVHWDDDGSLRIAGRLSAEDGALPLTALQAAQERLDSERPGAVPPGSAESPGSAGPTGPAESGGPGRLGEPPAVSEEPATGPPGRQSTQAEAIIELARAFLDPDPQRQSAAARHQVVVHLDADVLAADSAAGKAHLEGGPALSPQQATRIGCDASLVVMLRRGREVLDVGRATRTIPAAINRALWARDGGCRYPGCHERRRSHVQGHHIRFWSRGGRTCLAKLIRC